MPRLHVNIDHVATLRQARRETFPDPVAWALRAEAAGAVGITFHLRKDRRHIQDADVKALKKAVTTKLNFEMSLDPEIVEIAARARAEAYCIVPENRAEVTTEGGLDVRREAKRLLPVVARLARRGAEVSLFVDPDVEQLAAAVDTGAEFVELHTGATRKPRAVPRCANWRASSARPSPRTMAGCASTWATGSTTRMWRPWRACRMWKNSTSALPSSPAACSLV